MEGSQEAKGRLRGRHPAGFLDPHFIKGLGVTSGGPEGVVWSVIPASPGNRACTKWPINP